MCKVSCTAAPFFRPHSVIERAGVVGRWVCPALGCNRPRPLLLPGAPEGARTAGRDSPLPPSGPPLPGPSVAPLTRSLEVCLLLQWHLHAQQHAARLVACGGGTCSIGLKVCLTATKLATRAAGAGRAGLGSAARRPAAARNPVQSAVLKAAREGSARHVAGARLPADAALSPARMSFNMPQARRSNQHVHPTGTQQAQTSAQQAGAPVRR